MTISMEKLSNGLRVVSEFMPGVETVSLGLWVGAGTRHESEAVNGVAHMLEHMAFKGTQRRDARAIAEEIESVGGHLNAYTGREQTAYYAKVLKEDIALAVDIIADIVQNPLFDEEEMERERHVILQEIGQAADTPDDVIFDHFQARAYPGQGLGRPVLGSVDHVRMLGRSSLQDWLSSHYRPANMVFAVAGNIDHDKVVQLADAAFKGLSGDCVNGGERARYEGGDYREIRPFEQAHLVLGFDGMAVTDPDYYALSVLAMCFGGGMSSRLFQEVREKRGLAYSIYAFTSGYRDGGLFGVYAGTGANDVPQLMSVIGDEFEKLAADPAAGDELARARAQIKAGLLMSLESTGARCEQLGQQTLVFGGPLDSGEIIARIEAVDSAHLARLAARLRQTRPTIAALGPLAKLAPYEVIAARLAA